MNEDEKYQRQAEDAVRMAERAVSEEDRRAWLRIAQGYFSLIKRPARPVERESRGNDT
jgi:hypothetical protein